MLFAMSKDLSSALLWLAAALYLISLTLPGIIYQGGYIDYGYYILREGWQSLSPNMLAWNANPLFFLALFCAFIRMYREGLWFSIVALLLGLQSFFFHTKPNLPQVWHVDHLGVGFYVWELSFLVLTIFCFMQHKNARLRRAKI
jgi:hypothetical protein